MNKPECQQEGRRANSWDRFQGAGIVPRVAVIALFVPLLAAIAFFGGLAFRGFVLILVMLGLREFHQMAQAKGYEPFRYLGFISGIGIFLYVSFDFGPINMFLAAMVMTLMCAELFRRDMNHALTHIAITLFGILYVGWLGAHLVLLREMQPIGSPVGNFGLRALGLAVAITWTCDILAYLVGVSIGKHRLLPRVSPKKSVEGAVGGLLGACAIGGVAAATWLPVMPIWMGLLVGFVGGVLAQMGDLVESLLKRDAGIKDSAALLPGHGGVLDRFDSLYFVSPFVYYFLKLLVI
jgi:phosphatidate cytidylyltransferase